MLCVISLWFIKSVICLHQVQRALAHQTSLMKEMIQENPSKIPVIEISDDEDEEVDAEKSATNAVDSSPSTSNTPGTLFVW